MNKQDKDLLLKDLCARLPYGLKVKCEKYPFPVTVLYAGDVDEVKFKETGGIEHIDLIKPYLRPVSSMTQKEVETYHKKNQTSRLGALNVPIEHHLYRTQECIDWLIRNHFDFRGLISKGLAITAPKGMYHIRNRGI